LQEVLTALYTTRLITGQVSHAFSKIKLCQNIFKSTSLAMMTTKEKLIQEIERSPDLVIEELFDYLLLAKMKHHRW